jgi:hypothetical protein
MTLETFWLKDPLVLINPLYLHRFFPTDTLTDAEKMNAVMRASIYISIALVLYTGDWKWLFVIVITGLITAGYSANSLEGFRDWIRYKTMDTSTMDIVQISPEISKERMEEENPYMSYLVNEIMKHPGRREHSSKKKLGSCSRKDSGSSSNSNSKEALMYEDINDVYQKTQSQRSFAGTPGVNDQSEFARFLGYNSMRSCRDSSDQEQCYRGI